MAPIKRNRENTESTIETVSKAPQADISSILSRLDSVESANIEKDKIIAKLQSEVKEAKGDTSESVKDSKKIYGKNPDGTINEDEPHRYKYSVMMDEGKEKVVISQVTIGRPMHYQNFNTGKWTTEHKIEITFHDDTKKTMELTDFMEAFYYGGEGGDGDFVQYSDIKKCPDGSKDYTFRNTQFGDFTINKK